MAKRKQWDQMSRKEKRYGIIGVIVIVLVLIGIIGSIGGKSKTTNSTTVAKTVSSSASKPTTPAPASNQPKPASTAKKAQFVGVLYNIANNDNTPMTLPAAGWDANDGWDTATQASIDEGSASAVSPAVVVKNAHILELDINVHNTGNAAGTAECTIKASSSTGGNFSAGQYYGVNHKTVTALNGGDIQPDSYGNVVDDLTITGQGAQYVKQVMINC